MYLDHNISDALATVWAVQFGKAGKDDKPVCRLFFNLNDDPAVEGLEKTFFLHTEKGKKYFFDVIKEAFEWWGDWEQIGQEEAYGGIVGKQCRISTEATPSTKDPEKIFYNVSFVYHVNGRKTKKHELLDDSEMTSFLAELRSNAKTYELEKKAEGEEMPKATNTEDDVPF